MRPGDAEAVRGRWRGGSADARGGLRSSRDTLAGGDARQHFDALAVGGAQAHLAQHRPALVYVVGGDGKPLLRQVRLGRADGDRVEVLSGVSAGERVALDPQAAARIR